MRDRVLIIFTPSMYQVGGAEIYVKNKYVYLNSIGIDCIVVSKSIDSDIYPEINLNHFISFKEIDTPYYLFSEKKRNELIEKTVKKISILINQTKIFIESHNTFSPTWAESVSKKINAYHYIYFIGPIKLKKVSDYYFDFLKSIILNNRFFVMSDIENDTNTEGLKERDLILDKVQILTIPYYISEVISNKSNLSHLTDSKKKNILIIQRFDKSESLINMAYELGTIRNHKLNIIIVGDTKRGQIKTKVLNKFFSKKFPHSVNHLESIMPLDSSVFQGIDLFIGHGTAALASASNSVPTILYSGVSGRAVGVFGPNEYTLGLGAVNNSYVPQKLSDLIDTIFINPNSSKKYGETAKKTYQEFFDFQKVILSHVDLINLTTRQISYFEFINTKLIFKDLIKKYLILFFGFKNYETILNLYSRFNLTTRRN